MPMNVRDQLLGRIAHITVRAHTTPTVKREKERERAVAIVVTPLIVASTVGMEDMEDAVGMVGAEVTVMGGMATIITVAAGAN